jgi:CDP-4-dehydro-6-deoxyglucose reductase, E1
MADDWRSAIEREWIARHRDASQAGSLFPLIGRSFDQREIVAAVDALLSGRVTMGDRVRAFESKFAAKVGAPYAVMVNSGSSANLLALAVASNPARAQHLTPGAEVLVPAVCWSTSVWPIAQMGLKPVFVDVDPRTLNAAPADVREKITPRTRGLVAVHVLGNSAPMGELLGLARQHKLVVLEDTCESLGSLSGGKYLGTLGDFGAFSFYYSHHITSGEGGMVTCQTLEDYDLLKCLRAHGWSRELSNRCEIEEQNPDIDPRFLFVNLGYNLRPMEVQAAFGSCQLDRLDTMNRTRLANHRRIVNALRDHPRWADQFQIPEASPATTAVWFGFCALLHPRFEGQLQPFLQYLSRQGIENRPILSGNFVRQPGLKRIGVVARPEEFPGAEAIHRRGFFFGLHTDELTPVLVRQVADIVLGYEFG